MIVYGDGSFGLNGFEYDTAVRFNLPIIGVIGNDAAWGQMMRPQGAIYGWDRAAGDAAQLHALRQGGRGARRPRRVRASGPSEIRPALERAAASGKPALVNVMIRQDREYKGGIYV